MAKLVEVLARELKVWPEGITKFTCDPCGEVRGHPYIEHDFYPQEDVDLDERTKNLAGFGDDLPAATRAMWESERAKQKGGEWKRHRGGKQPVSDETMVDVRFHDGSVENSKRADYWEWRKDESDPRITSYRVLEKPEQEEKEVIPTHMIFGYESKEAMIAQIGEVKPFEQIANAAKVDQVEGPIKWRDHVAELEAYIEEFTRQRDDLVNRLALEGFSLIPHSQPVQGSTDNVDMQDWRNWKEGDILLCVEPPEDHKKYYTSGCEYSIGYVDLNDEQYPVEVHCDSGFTLWCSSSSFKFIRRP